MADLRLCDLTSLRPYVLAILMSCALMSAPLCRRSQLLRSSNNTFLSLRIGTSAAILKNKEGRLYSVRIPNCCTCRDESKQKKKKDPHQKFVAFFRQFQMKTKNRKVFIRNFLHFFVNFCQAKKLCTYLSLSKQKK